MAGLTKLLDAVTANTEGAAFELPFPYLNYGLTAQVGAGADVTAYSVTIQGRTSEDVPWVTLATVTQASAAEDHLVAGLTPTSLYRAVLASYAQDGADNAVTVELVYAPQDGTVMVWNVPGPQQDATPYPASQSWPEAGES